MDNYVVPFPRTDRGQAGRLIGSLFAGQPRYCSGNRGLRRLQVHVSAWHLREGQGDGPGGGADAGLGGYRCEFDRHDSNHA